ncbi:MAG: PASTA domain-containing protein, partial [Solirubrobacteraceae bacterium]
MTTRAPTSRAIEVPDLVGDKADQAIQDLRALGLMPIMWSAAVEDVNDAGFVLGLDPPAGTAVRPKAHVTMSVATHPDFQGHTDDPVAEASDELVQPPLTWPLSGPTGFAPPVAEPAPPPLGDAFPTAAAPPAPSAPASPPLDAASREVRHSDAEASSVGEPSLGVAADPYPQDLSAPVPTPDEISADGEWDRLRAAEAARHAAGDTSVL